MATSSVSSSLSSLYSNTLRISGLATGMDTDAIITELMNVERIPLDKLYQKKQLAEWKSDAYRSITSTLSAFKSEFFDVLKPATNMRSHSIYEKYTSTSSDTSVVTASGGVGLTATSHKIIVNQIATASSSTSASSVSKALVGDSITSFTATDTNNSFNLTVNGVTKTITLANGSYTDAASIIGNGSDGLLSQKVKEAFGNLNVVVDSSSIKFTSTVASDTISVTTGTNDVLGNLGFTTGESNKIKTGETLETISEKLVGGAITFDIDGNFKLTINGTDIIANKTDTLSSLITKVNSSDANVTMSYSSLSDTFKITSKSTGEGSITLNDNGSNFFTATGLTAVDAGKNASVVIDGIAASRATNNFTVDGVTYNLLKADVGVEKTISLTRDVDATYNSIKSFVDKYNEVISKLNTAISEKYDRDYQPLTDAQKEAMTEDEITKWETKAKTGLLKNDSILQGIVSDMRQALYESVSGVEGNLSSIGITTGAYDEKGKLYIDETKLKEAIQNSPDTVMDLFSKESDIAYSPNLSTADRATRYSENGLINRLYDTIQDSIRTTRDSNGNKGSLLEKAGMVGDASEFTNYYYKEIESYSDKIETMNDRLADIEERYYAKYTALETAISRMNSQSSYISSMFSSSSGS